MGESKAAVRERLKREGRWPDAVRFRERKKAEGKPHEEAWGLMLAAFPPLPAGGQPPPPALANGQPQDLPAPAVGAEPPAPTTPAPPPESPPAKKRRRRRRAGEDESPGSAMLRVIRWVFENMGEAAHDGRPPCGGALGLLAWAKKEPAEFYRTYLAKLIPSRAEQEAEAASRRKDEERLAWLRRQVDEAEVREKVREWELDECKKRLVEEGVIPYDPDGHKKAAPPAPPAVVRHQPDSPPAEEAPAPRPAVTPHPLCGDCKIHGVKSDCACCAHLRRYAPNLR